MNSDRIIGNPEIKINPSYYSGKVHLSKLTWLHVVLEY